MNCFPLQGRDVAMPKVKRQNGTDRVVVFGYSVNSGWYGGCLQSAILLDVGYSVHYKVCMEF